MTSGGLRTSSEVERLVPSSHSAAGEEEKSVKTCLDPCGNTQAGTTSSPTGVSAERRRKQGAPSISEDKDKCKSQNLQITWSLNVNPNLSSLPTG